MRPKHSSLNTASGSTNNFPLTEVLGTNEQLDFALEGYVNPDAKPGVTPTPETAARAIMAMFCFARQMVARSGAPNGDWAEEALSLALKDIAQSKLTRRYQPRPAGPKPYIHRIIQRNVWKVISKAMTEQRRYKAISLPVEIVSRDMNPAQVAELEDLAARCHQLLADDIAEPWTTNPCEPGSSTPGVQKHRHRKEQWRRIAHLFPDVSFRPKPRRGQASRKPPKSLDTTIPLKLSAAQEQ
jgi:hypothetical protein